MTGARVTFWESWALWMARLSVCPGHSPVSAGKVKVLCPGKPHSVGQLDQVVAPPRALVSSSFFPTVHLLFLLFAATPVFLGKAEGTLEGEGRGKAAGS